MVGPKVEIIMDEMHPYIQTSSNRISMKNVQGCISFVIILTTPVCVLLALPSPTYFFNLFSCFIYLFAFLFLSSIATESTGVV